jgi:transcriptional regulator with XRE-family HTH domain
MAIDMGLSSSAYRKIEMGETKLTVERLLQIAEVLDSPLDSLFENNDKKNFNQENHDNETVNAYQGNSYPDISTLTNKILSIYEKQIEELKSEIKDLKNDNK